LARQYPLFTELSAVVIEYISIDRGRRGEAGEMLTRLERIDPYHYGRITRNVPPALV
jgi:hypothetical protein